jgi:hypothetical protein
MMGEDGAADGRRLMFGVVEQWWRGANQDELRRKLSRDGVENMENHLEGVHDTGHGCGKPLGMARNIGGGASSGPMGEAASGLMGAIAGAAGGGGAFGIEKLTEGAMGMDGGASGVEKFAEEAVGGGALGGLVGALAGGVGGGLLSGAFGGREEPETRSFSSRGRTQEGGYQQSYTEFGRSGNQYAQAQFSETQLPGGRRETDYQRFQQQGEYGSGFEQRTESRPTYGGGFEQTTERIYQRPGEVETETWREGRTADGRHYHEAQPEFRSERKDSSSDSDDSGHKKHHKKKHHGHSEREEREDYIAPGGYGAGFGGQRGETFEERRHEREFESQPSYGYEPPRREIEERNEFSVEGFGNRLEGQGLGYGSHEFGNEAGWGNEGAREERVAEERREEYQEERREEYQEEQREEYQEEQREEYQEERREEQYREEVREEEYREERSEGGGWFS